MLLSYIQLYLHLGHRTKAVVNLFSQVLLVDLVALYDEACAQWGNPDEAFDVRQSAFAMELRSLLGSTEIRKVYSFTSLEELTMMR